MLRSMTGFGRADGEADGVRYAVEIRSVNNRHLKTVIKLPDCLSAAEMEVEKQLRSRLGRGTVTLSVQMKLPDEAAAYRVNAAALAGYLDQLKPLEAEANPMLRVDLGSLLQLPGVCEPPPLEDLCRSTHATLMELIHRALDGLVAMRELEGEALAADLNEHCATVRELLDGVAQRTPQVVAEYHEKLATRVDELLRQAKLNIDEEALAREVAIFADRCDVAEEIARLGGHLEHFGQALAANQPAGRKLDFIAQEMLREANTIASKANDAEIGRTVVEIKTAIDRIKEQVQNAE